MLRGTRSSGWLALAGAGLIIWGIIEMVTECRTKQKLARESAEGGGSDKVQAGGTQQIKARLNKNASAAVFIYRISVYAGLRNPYIISCHGTLSANLPNGFYALLRVPEGKHKFASSAAMSGIRINFSFRPDAWNHPMEFLENRMAFDRFSFDRNSMVYLIDRLHADGRSIETRKMLLIR